MILAIIQVVALSAGFMLVVACVAATLVMSDERLTLQVATYLKGRVRR
jgi:hypothetical protein